MDAFSERLKQLREEQGVTQNEFSKRLGISRVSLTHYEAGDRTPDIEFLKRLHQETGVSLYYLLGLSDSKDDALATAQRDTGLSEKALEQFAVHPISTKVINYLVDCGALFCITLRAAILHDDIRIFGKNPPEEWSDILQMMRDDHFGTIEKEMTATLSSMLIEGITDDKPFGAPQNLLPTNTALATLEKIRTVRDSLLNIAEQDEEAAALAEQYTKTLDALLTKRVKEGTNGKTTPEQ